MYGYVCELYCLVLVPTIIDNKLFAMCIVDFVCHRLLFDFISHVVQTVVQTVGHRGFVY